MFVYKYTRLQKIHTRIRIRSYKVKSSYESRTYFHGKSLLKQISMIFLSQEAYQEAQKDRVMSLEGNQAIRKVISTLEG